MKSFKFFNLVILFFGICFLTSGCIQNDVLITFDNKDNMKVETRVLYAKEIQDYVNIQDMHADLEKEINTKVVGANINTKLQDIDNSSGKGICRIDLCKNISRSKKVEKISIITPMSQEDGILKVENFIFLKKYIIRGNVLQSKTTKDKLKSDSFLGDFDPSTLISSKIKIKVPSMAKKIEANTNLTDSDDESIYVWKVDYSKESNPIELNFIMVNWILSIAIILVIMFAVIYVFYKAKIKFNTINLKKIADETIEKFIKVKVETENVDKLADINDNSEKECLQRNKTNKGFWIISVIILGTVTLFLLIPIICQSIIDMGIQRVAIGKIDEAKSYVNVASMLNMNRNQDLMDPIFEEAINAVKNNDLNSGAALFDLMLKTKSRNKFETYSMQLVDYTKEAITSKKYKNVSIYAKYACKFNPTASTTLKNNLHEENKKLALSKDFNNAQIVVDTLLAIDSKNEKAYLEKAMIMFCKGEIDKAIEASTTAININNTYAPAYYYRGFIYASSKFDYDRAIYNLNQALKYGKDTHLLAETRYQMATAHFKKKFYRKAMNDAWIAKDLYHQINLYDWEDESYRLFNVAADYECRFGGYCY